MTHAEYMPRVVRGWLNALHGQSQGWIFIGSTANTDAGTRWMNGDVFETTPEGLDRAARYVDQLDERGRSGIYVRVTTLREQPARGPDGEATRGAASDSLSLPGLAADIDIAGPGHKHDPDRHGGLTLPPDELVARLIVDTSGLPNADRLAAHRRRHVPVVDPRPARRLLAGDADRRPRCRRAARRGDLDPSRPGHRPSRAPPRLPLRHRRARPREGLEDPGHHQQERRTRPTVDPHQAATHPAAATSGASSPTRSCRYRSNP
jgi:hypothetical protein